MKRQNDLWQQIVSEENLRNAYEMSVKGKSHYSAVKKVKKDLEAHLACLQSMLVNGEFKTGEYKIEERMESGKMRTIYKLPYYPDRIVHHALMLVVGPILKKSLIRDTFQSLPGRGTSDARRRVQKMVKLHAPRYALQMDIKKYYPSVNNDTLKIMIRRKIKCAKTLELIDNIVDSMKGLPIGSLTSQYFGNFYLSSFDWFVKQDLRAKNYYRYCDDLVIFHDRKKVLREWFKRIKDELEILHLTIKPTWQILDMEKQGVDFVGYVFKQDQTRLRPAIAQRFKRLAKTITRKGTPNKANAFSLIAYKGWMMRCNAKQLWRKSLRYGALNRCGLYFKKNPLKGAL